LKCAQGDCAGDPHCTSFDGIKFDYQGLRKYYLLKPCQPYTSLPNFELRAINYPIGVVAALDTVELVIPEWERILSLALPMPGRAGFILTVNSKQREIDYQYPSADECSTDFVKVYYTDKNTKTHVVIETSFGLKATLAAAYINVQIPKHPELKQKLCGLLGRPDGNQANDFLDCKGVQQTPQVGVGPFNWAFGDSCIVPDAGVFDMKCFRADVDKQWEEHKKNIDPAVENKWREVCKANLENPELVKCAKKAGRTLISVEACVFDVLFLKSDSERKQFIKNLMRGPCHEKEIEFKEPATNCVTNLVPLYRLYAPDYDTNYYTPSIYHASYHSTLNPIRFFLEGSPGQVASSAASCDGTAYTEVYVMYGPPGGNPPRQFGKHLYLRADELAANEKEGYQKGLLANFFCAAKAGQCGATIPLRRYVIPNGGRRQVLTINPRENPQLTPSDTLCYIWPHPPQPAEWTKLPIYNFKGADF